MKAAERLARQSLFQEEEFFRPWALTVLGVAQAGRGAAAAALATLQMAVEAAQLQEDLYGEAYALEALGKVCWQGEQAAARRWLTQAHRLYSENGFAFEAQRLRTEMTELGL